jgi:hypothetical protein
VLLQPFSAEIIFCCLGQLSSAYTQETNGLRGDSTFSTGVMHQCGMRPFKEGLGGPSANLLKNAAEGAQAGAIFQPVQPLSEQARNNQQAAQHGISGAASASQLKSPPPQHFSNGRGQIHPVQQSPYFGRGQGSGPTKQQTGPIMSGGVAYGQESTSISGGARGGRGGTKRQGVSPLAGSAIQNFVGRGHAQMPTAPAAASPPAVAAHAAGPTAARGSSRGRSRGRQ